MLKIVEIFQPLISSQFLQRCTEFKKSKLNSQTKMTESICQKKTISNLGCIKRFFFCHDRRSPFSKAQHIGGYENSL